MAVFWVQYWGYLPAIFAEQMNDGAGPGGRQTLSDRRDIYISTTGVNPPNRHPSSSEIPPGHASMVGAQTANSGSQADDSSATPRPVPTSFLASTGPTTVVSQASLPEQVLSYSVSSSGAQGTSPYTLSQPYPRESINPFNLAHVSTSLPEYQSTPLTSFSQHRLLSSVSTPGMMYQFQHVPQFAGQTAILNYHNNPNWVAMPLSSQYHPPYPQNSQLTSPNPALHNYPQHFPGQTTQLTGPTPGQHMYPNPSWTLQQQQQSLPAYYLPGAGQVQTSQGRLTGRYNVTSSRRATQPLMEVFPRSREARAGVGSVEHGFEGVGATYGSPHENPAQSDEQGYGRMGLPSSSSRPSIPRGPPRKPKQSGHALWVGNLPPATTVIELKDYFSRDATRDIESVFLISKSNCAFVNYKTEEACMAAMARFHDSRFNGVRLVCRLRRTLNSSATGVPTGPASVPHISSAEVLAEDSPLPTTTRDPISMEARAGPIGTLGAPEGPKKDRYFIVKSLTVEDLEASVRNGIWATQAHNEVILNEAYASANVYLIFSANKSGEYFGYARMVSPISDDTTSVISWAPRAQPIEEVNHPRAIPTPATEFAPKGRVIDDSARGTIFWEADTDEEDEDEEDEEEEEEKEPGEGVAQSANHPEVPTEIPMADEEGGGGKAGGFSQGASGRPFKIEWLCTIRLPFYRARGLRNPWNGNREVKIARDGTELETSVGRRLLQLFHRVGGVGSVAGVAAPMSSVAVGMPAPQAYPLHHQHFTGSAPVVSSTSISPPSTTAAHLLRDTPKRAHCYGCSLRLERKDVERLAFGGDLPTQSTNHNYNYDVLPF
ncbi:MAG: hypothetical protein M1816_003060 [Peltula sp. TS41687]|nr:MAG: hypothetical protein M1816_003060 [Peltula sp. TS41687]